MQSIRGAITIEENEVKYIKEASIKLFSEILIRNNINIEDIISIFISCTKDIDKDYPGKYIREDFNLKNVAIMHFNEMYVEGSMPLCIRILILIDKKNKNVEENIEYVYLGKAKTLRKDLFSSN
ncbi:MULTISPECIES: chorismate mutase [Clostridium]|uniref:chorismate mutase n=3 Tax=Clostridium TaxID=1485 RepID=A0A7X5P795_CLOSG|nr:MULTISPECIES: chorismate mutase [Clostridium]AJD32822.1 chorismate mutase [Clostridium botulinum Prevot_594]AVP61486.1 chorismate mutase [Clostridium botulinum]AKC62520.1 chorismate mutase [Clostridium sporogenes]AKJ89780.1 chorismate mutase [Clostridium sporogenes]AVP65011.1 chorismate mutase [Clostridium botulinum]